MTIRTLAIVAAIAVPTLSLAAQCSKDSPPHAVALLELYTSEGCDSCPPAERWLSRLGRNAKELDSVVPLALHVDYWDRLGWKDRFANTAFTARHRALAVENRSPAVFTPDVFLNLRAFREWDSSASLRKALRSHNARPAGADIRLVLEPPSPAGITVSAWFKPGPGARRPLAFVVLYENGLSTEVKAGENRGVTLRHDHVVRAWIGPLDPAAPFQRTLALEPDWKAANLGVAAFVHDLASGEILQASALGICNKG